MNTIDLNAYRNELAREILATDSLEVLETVYRAYRKAVSKAQKSHKKYNCKEEEYPARCSEQPSAYLTQAELDADIEAAIRDENADDKEVQEFYNRWNSLQ